MRLTYDLRTTYELALSGMGRPPLSVGTHGTIGFTIVAGSPATCPR